MNSSKTSGNSSTSGSRHNSSSNNNASSGGTATNSSSNKNSSSSVSSANNNKSNTLKGSQHTASGGGGVNGGANNNNSTANNNNNNNTTHTSNGLNIGSAPGAGGHNSSPILPMTPSTSVSPPINVICKKEVSSYHSSSNGSLAENLKTSPYDSTKESELGIHYTAAYANVNARLGQGGGGNLTPLGSNSSIMTTPSPPMTPQASHNPLSYVPNHESYTNFWHNQYNNYPSNAYNASYYQMDYFQNQSQSNYNMGHSGYSTSNFGLTSGSSLSGAMGAQAFSPNLDYMSPQDKYVNMV